MLKQFDISNKIIGITSTIPVEVLFAGGFVPVDLNNIFITSPQAGTWVDEAEEKGFPRTLCSWIKGIYSALQYRPEIKTVIAVTQGDCSNTQALTEILDHQGIKIIHFNYPYDRNPDLLKKNMEALMDFLRGILASGNPNSKTNKIHSGKTGFTGPGDLGGE